MGTEISDPSVRGSLTISAWHDEKSPRYDCIAPPVLMGNY